MKAGSEKQNSHKQFALCGIGNALVDMFVDVSEHEFAELGFERSTMRLVSSQEQHDLFSKLGIEGSSQIGSQVGNQISNAARRAVRQASGGSVANSIIAFAQLVAAETRSSHERLKAAFITSVGSDSRGQFYRQEFESFGIAFPSKASGSGAPTGTCLALITPDAERTMRTCLGATQELGASHIDEEAIARSQWLFIEGYALSNPGGGAAVAETAVQLARKHGTKVAFTCSEAWVVDGFRPLVDHVLANADMVICNDAESQALTGRTSGEAAFGDLIARFPSVIVTQGPKGARVRWMGGEPAAIAAVPCTPRDLTGAGDMFAGAFFAGVLGGKSPAESGARAAALCSRVISQIGARLASL